MSAMLVHIRVTCFSKNYMQKRVRSYNWCQFTAEKYGFWAKTIHSFIWSRQVVQIPLSDYAKRLDGKVRERYLKKILKIGVDPALLVGNPSNLTVFRRLNGLIYFAIWFRRPAFTRKNNWKPFAVRLVAYNQMVSGIVYNVQGHIIANKFVVLAKVRHSQRMNEALIQIIVCRTS